MTASETTLAALELPRLLELFAAEARTDLGAARLRGLGPTADRAELERRRAAYVEVDRLVVEAPLVPSLDAELGPLLERLESELPPLDGGEIVVVARLLAAAGEAVARIRAAESPLPELGRRVAEMPDPRPLVERIERVLDPRGRVRDDASPALVELARQARAARARIYGALERVRTAQPELFTDETVPLRAGRLQLVLSSGARGRVPGLVHGRSASGKSFYFEPLEVVEENNVLESAVEEMESERLRLLRELLEALRAELPRVRALAALLGELDALESAGRVAAVTGARLVALAESGGPRLRGARHPLLDPRLAGRRDRVFGAAGHTGEIVPLDLELDAERRLLVVTGPNAGGKTVALKCLGLAALATQCGLPVACEAGSELPCFERVVATVGDDQDMLTDRSTFSGRLLRLAEAWEAASPRALVLVDELGSGTDPEEGAALSVALVERLVERGAFGVVTTHLVGVALAALERPGASCAAMEFEPSSGRPTFRLIPGAPGASEAIALARRLGLPAAWIARAEELVGPEHRDLHRVLAELEASRVELERARAAAAEREGEAERRRAALAREQAALEAERRTVAKRLEAELASFRERVAGEMRQSETRLRDELAAGRRRAVAAKETARLFAAAPSFTLEEEARPAGPLEVGATVRHRALGWEGRLEKLDGERAEVAVRGKRVRAAKGDLLVLADAAEPESAGGTRALPSAAEAPAELLLLGVRVEAGLDAVDAYLDEALRAGRQEVRVVHGHGTGRLREAIREHLRGHPAVATFRPGAPNEGGNGATVVTLRE